MGDSSIQTYISLLRGINVGGHRKVKMEELKTLYEGLQFQNVSTYIQSGNVVFQTSLNNCKHLSDLISEELNKQFGFPVPVIVKKIAEFQDIYENNPFLKQNMDTQKLYAIFLSDDPDEYAIDQIAEKSKEDIFVLYKSTIYLFCSNRYGKTKLTNTFFENNLKVVATTRGWASVSKIYQIAQKLSDQ